MKSGMELDQKQTYMLHMKYRKNKRYECDGDALMSDKSDAHRIRP